MAPSRDFVVGAVEGDEHRVEAALVGRRRSPTTASRISPLTLVDGPGDALAAVAVVAVAELDRLVGARARAARDRGPAARAREQLDLHLDGGVAAGVEDLPADDVLDVMASSSLLLLLWTVLRL